MAEREQDSMMGWQMPNANTIQCRDCDFRDRAKLHLNGKDLPVGVTRDTCAIFPSPPNFKPNGVLFGYEQCPYYKKE